MIGVVLAGCVLFLGCASAALWVLCKPPPPKPAVKQITFQQPEEVVQVDDEFVVYEPKCKSDEPKTKSESVRHALSVAVKPLNATRGRTKKMPLGSVLNTGKPFKCH
ncbi:hypothetical protein T484DRAFT_2953208 [Baffinella frigidus]|nr:hypothetical protein T484DRAFT_2953208 [Cryptophyta sp. CCMP2293]